MKNCLWLSKSYFFVDVKIENIQKLFVKEKCRQYKWKSMLWICPPSSYLPVTHSLDKTVNTAIFPEKLSFRQFSSLNFHFLSQFMFRLFPNNRTISLSYKTNTQTVLKYTENICSNKFFRKIWKWCENQKAILTAKTQIKQIFNFELEYWEFNWCSSSW